jgi:hypothetical protein
MNNPIRIELVATPQGWTARIEGMEDYESNPSYAANKSSWT